MRTMMTLLAMAAGATAAPAQEPGTPPSDPAIMIGRLYRMESKVLAESRPYIIFQTPGPQRQSLPTIVLLDGSGHFVHTVATVRFLTEQGRIPGARVVAIPNTTDRTRDLTPPPLDAKQRTSMQTAGGASKLLAFIADELLPQVERDYGPAPMRIIIGHSLGGLTAAHAMLTRPSLFHAYVMISPSLWYDNYRIADSLIARIATEGVDASWIHASVGGLEDRVQTEPFGRVVNALRDAGGRVPPWQFTVMPTEDHGSTPMRTTYDALEHLFTLFRLSPDSTRRLGVAGIDRHYDALKKRFGYPDHVPEHALNTLGYGLLADSTAAGRANAVGVLRENVRRFPRSANVYDSLGDALRTMGRNEQAMSCYATAIDLGRTAPQEGETFANQLLIPGASGKLAATASALGRIPWTVIPPGVREACMAD